MPTKEEAIRELARRELAKREQQRGEGFFTKLKGALEPGVRELMDLNNMRDVLNVGGNAMLLHGPEGRNAKEKADIDASRERLGGGAGLAELGGGMLTPTGVPAKVGKGLQIAGHGISGGVQAGLDTYNQGGDAWDVGKSVVVGSGLGSLASGVGGAVSDWWNRGKEIKGQKFQSGDEVLDASKDKYQEVKRAGGVYHRDDVRGLFAEINQMDLDPITDARLVGLRSWLSKRYNGKDVDPEKLDTIRKLIREKMATPNRSDRVGGETFVKAMDKFTERVNPVNQATGADIPGVNEMLKEARLLHSTGKNAKKVEKAAPQKSGPFNMFGESGYGASQKRFAKEVEKADARGGAGFSKDVVERMRRLSKPDIGRSAGELGRRISPLRGNSDARLFAGLTGWLSGTMLPAAQTAIGEGLVRFGEKGARRELDDLKALVRDPQGIGIKPNDPAVIAAARERLARLAGGVTRKGLQPNRGQE